VSWLRQRPGVRAPGWWAFALLLMLATGCSTGARVSRGDGQTIAQARAEPVDGPKYRIVVGRIVDKTDPQASRSIARQVGYLNARSGAEHVDAQGILGGIHDLLVTELFNSGQFIVLDRDNLNDIYVEQAFTASAAVGDETRLPQGELEGAELLVVGAVTAFDAGVDGAALPIPIPLGKDFSKGFGIVSLGFKRGFVAMDLRVIDVATGRIVATTAVEGRNSNYGIELKGIYSGRTGYIPLPGLLKAFSNTPVEAALQKMAIAAIGTIAAQKPSKRAPESTSNDAPPPVATTPPALVGP